MLGNGALGASFPSARGVDGQFGGVMAGVYNIGPAWGSGMGGLKDFNLWHRCLGLVMEARSIE